jgi:hypothetical protein
MFYRVLILSCICLLSKSAFSSEAEQINTEASPSVKSSIVSQDDYEIAFKDVKPLPINDMQWVEARIFIDKPVGFHLSIRNKSDNPYYMQTWYQTYRGNGIQKVEHHSMSEWELPPYFLKAQMFLLRQLTGLLDQQRCPLVYRD